VAKLLQALHRDADWECMMIAGSWPFRWAAEKGRGGLSSTASIRTAVDLGTLTIQLSISRSVSATLHAAFGRGIGFEAADGSRHFVGYRLERATLRCLSEAVGAGCEQLVSLLPARSQREQALERRCFACIEPGVTGGFRQFRPY
jgi:hypothetical protein